MGFRFWTVGPINQRPNLFKFSKLTFSSASSLLSELNSQICKFGWTTRPLSWVWVPSHSIIHSQFFIFRNLKCQSVVEPRKPRKQPNQYPNLNLNCSHHNSSTSKSKVHIYTSIFSFFPFYERAFSSIYFYRLMLAISMLC